jgi:hypothetical protein
MDHRPNGDFPIAALDEAVRSAGRIAASSQDAVENVLGTSYGDATDFLALSLLYDETNWGTIQYSIDHLFSQDDFKKNVPDHVKELRDDFGNLALVIGDENSGKKNRPLHEWLATRSPAYLKRHFIPADQSLWHIEKYENFLIERHKLLKARIQQVLLSMAKESRAQPDRVMSRKGKNRTLKNYGAGGARAQSAQEGEWPVRGREVGSQAI